MPLLPTDQPAAPGDLQPESKVTEGAPQRRRYEPPRVVKKETLAAATLLVSGADCVFDPPGSC
jgi:hypothetical protein